MSLHHQWAAISNRVRGLAQAATLYADFMGIRSSDTFSMSDRLRKQCLTALDSLIAFRETFRPALPATVLAAINALEASKDLLKDGMNKPSRGEAVATFLVELAALEAEITFLLTGSEQRIRTRTQLAFLHLQRLIVVDEQLRGRWQTAFAQGEVACERLGAAHLLQHGIWAFKVDAAGARTDLVYQEPPNDLNEIARSVEGVVLTEWKKAESDRQAEAQFASARLQASKYAEGPLAGIELTTYRFLIVITERQVLVRDELEERGITYVHINIAVNPQTPSK